MLLAVEPGTKLWVFPHGCKGGDGCTGGDDGCDGGADGCDANDGTAAAADDDTAAVLVRLEVGEVMVWRGDLVHAGAGYATEHTRIHAYVDPPAKYYARPFGKTNLCRSSADETRKF